MGREEESKGKAMARVKQMVWKGRLADKRPGKDEGLAFVLECETRSLVFGKGQTKTDATSSTV